MVRCNTCGGTYEPILPDGMQYFHACPPLGVRELRDRLQAGTLVLSRADQLRLQAAQDADRADPVPAGQPTRVDTLLSTLVVERPAKRDENIVREAVRGDQPARIKAEGTGVTTVPAP